MEVHENDFLDCPRSALNFYSLDMRRMNGDLIETYKIHKDLDRFEDKKKFPLAVQCKTTARSLQMSAEKSGIFFIEMVINLWNSVLQEAVDAQLLGLSGIESDLFFGCGVIKVYKDSIERCS